MLDFLLVFLGLIVVSGLVYGLATFVFGRGEEQAPMPPDVVPMLLPEGRPLTAADVRGAHLPVSVRGYRMSDVDALLDRIAEELERRGGSAPAPTGARVVDAELEQTGPTAAVGAEQLVEPVEPVEPIGAAEAIEPVEPIEPSEPSEPPGPEEVEQPRSAP